MDRDTDAVQVGGSFERRRGPSILVGVVGILVLVALVKPWSFSARSGPGGAGGSQGANRPAASASAQEGGAVPTASLGAPDVNAVVCFAADREQLVLLERWPDTEVRSWIAITTVDSVDPLDPVIPTTTIYSSHLIGIGICPPPPGNGSGLAGAWLLGVQRITSSATGRTAVDIGRGPTISRITGNPDVALLYGPAVAALPAPSEIVPGPSASLGSGPVRRALPVMVSWSSGTYLLSFAYPIDETPRIHWIQIEIRPGPRGAG